MGEGVLTMVGGPPPLPSIPYPSWLGSTAAHKVPSPPGGTGGPAAPPAPGPGSTAGLGDTVTVPPELKKGLGEAWADSFPGGKSQEQAGVLVQKADGTVEWRRVVDGVSGRSVMFSQTFSASPSRSSRTSALPKPSSAAAVTGASS